MTHSNGNVEPKDSICLPDKLADTAFQLCRAEQQTDLHNKTYVVVILGLWNYI